ncbi:hypothetical protein [Bradyrhizobium sp. CCBAU 53380]|uniref:hypothetical protein n=1 Tax=Bradyrhizobium sp. CCBAU 53380 TaxID=1325117 RepID=UPI002303B271|nr:hypothetical protein [Bradyrhizobium sp. CCBAU 53380]
MQTATFPKARSVARPSFFTGPKCKVAIPVHDPLHLDALLQASLTPSVRTIGYRTGPKIECPTPVSLAGIVLHLDNGLFLLRIGDRRQRSPEDDARLAHVFACHGLRLLERAAADIRGEPLFSNARAVWTHAGRQVSLMDRLRIGMALDEYGPQPIAELERRICPGRDLLAAVCALACENLLRLDIESAALGSRTLVFSS